MKRLSLSIQWKERSMGIEKGSISLAVIGGDKTYKVILAEVINYMHATCMLHTSLQIWQSPSSGGLY